MRHRLAPLLPLALLVLRALAIFLLLLTLLETVSRQAWVAQAFPYRSLGNHHSQFEAKWFGLQDFVAANGGVDVLIVGSSLVNTGLDPDLIAQAYVERRGMHLRIYNFGVEGLRAGPVSVVAGLLVETYHPALLIYVTEMRDYIDQSDPTGPDFLNDPWLRYRTGSFDPAGWLIDHSAFLQLYLPYRNWTAADYPAEVERWDSRAADQTAAGYSPDRKIGTGIDLPPDPSDPLEARNFELCRDYSISSAGLEGLAAILSSVDEVPQTNVLVVEMPVHPTYFEYVGGEGAHRLFQQQLSTFVHAHGGLFLSAETCDDLPLTGYANRMHLNYLGAPVFSTCLGWQLESVARQLGSFLVRP